MAAEDTQGAAVSRLVAGSSVVTLLRRGQLAVTSGVSTAVVARCLHPAGYGTLQAALATWALVLALCDLGFTLALGRDLATAGDGRGPLLRAAYQVQGTWSLVVAAGLAAGGLAVGGERGQLLLVLAPSVACAAFLSGRALLMAVYDATGLAKIDVVTNVAQVAVTVAVVLRGGGPVAVAVAISAGTAVNSVWVGRRADRIAGGGRPAGGSRRELLRRVLPLGAMGLLSKAYLTIDLAIIGGLVPAAALGAYAGAVKVATLLNTIPGLLMAAAMPGLAGLAADPVAARQLRSRLLHWLIVPVLPVFALVGLFPSVVSRVALGAGYAQAAPLISILAAACAVGVLSQFLGTMLVAVARIRPLFVQNTVAVAVNVAGNLLLVPRYGVAAAAWLTLLTEVIVCAGSLRTLSAAGLLAFERAAVRRPLYAVGVGLAACAVVRPWGWMGLPLAAVAFAGAVVAFHAWPAELTLPRRPVGRHRAPAVGRGTA